MAGRPPPQSRPFSREAMGPGPRGRVAGAPADSPTKSAGEIARPGFAPGLRNPRPQPRAALVPRSRLPLPRWFPAACDSERRRTSGSAGGRSPRPGGAPSTGKERRPVPAASPRTGSSPRHGRGRPARVARRARASRGRGKNRRRSERGRARGLRSRGLERLRGSRTERARRAGAAACGAGPARWRGWTSGCVRPSAGGGSHRPPSAVPCMWEALRRLPRTRGVPARTVAAP
ncbi:MAG: hypothetical protein KatS3mg076_1410 [Candidatus Binatia bacterium]|nr:MAG: hypothetical protein KatS3mg076_1410 [Candidatus Binatia bacterium]